MSEQSFIFAVLSQAFPEYQFDSLKPACSFLESDPQAGEGDFVRKFTAIMSESFINSSDGFVVQKVMQSWALNESFSISGYEEVFYGEFFGAITDDRSLRISSHLKTFRDNLFLNRNAVLINNGRLLKPSTFFRRGDQVWYSHLLQVGGERFWDDASNFSTLIRDGFITTDMLIENMNENMSNVLVSDSDFLKSNPQIVEPLFSALSASAITSRLSAPRLDSAYNDNVLYSQDFHDHFFKHENISINHIFFERVNILTGQIADPIKKWMLSSVSEYCVSPISPGYLSNGSLSFLLRYSEESRLVQNKLRHLLDILSGEERRNDLLLLASRVLDESVESLNGYPSEWIVEILKISR